MNQDQLYYIAGEAAISLGGLREGDTGLGLPDPEPAMVRRLKPEETQAYEEQVEAEWHAQMEKKLADLEHAAASFEIPKGVKSFASQAMLLAAALLGLFLVSQMVHTIADIEKLPLMGQWLTAGALVLAGGVVLYFVGRLLYTYFRLQQTRQVNIRALQIIAERKRMQTIAEEKTIEARRVFTSYLRDYPLAKLGPEKCKAWGLEISDYQKLCAARDRLLDAHSSAPHKQWLDDFVASFQSVLDKTAESRVGHYAMKAGLATSTSPNAVLDQMIIIYMCTAMVGDLMKIYNVRPALGQTGAILAQSIAHAYLSGMLEDMTDTAANSMGDSLAHMAHTTGAELVGLRVAKVVSAKLAEGTINGLLVRRLGRQTIRILQPARK